MNMLELYKEPCEFCGSDNTKAFTKEEKTKCKGGWLIKQFIEIKCEKCGKRKRRLMENEQGIRRN